MSDEDGCRRCGDVRRLHSTHGECRGEFTENHVMHRCPLHGDRPEMQHEDAICNLCLKEAMTTDTSSPNWWKRPENGGPERMSCPQCGAIEVANSACRSCGHLSNLT